MVVCGIALLIWMLAIFPGLFAEVVLGSYNLCPSFSNVTANREMCDGEHYSSYSGCMWIWLGGCGASGLILCGVVAFIVLTPIALYKGYKELKLTDHGGERSGNPSYTYFPMINQRVLCTAWKTKMVSMVSMTRLGFLNQSVVTM